MLMAFISQEVAEISSKMAEWKGIANKVSELSKNSSSSERSQGTVVIVTFSSSFLDLMLIWFMTFFHNRKIKKHVLSVRRKVFENSTLEQCLSLQKNGEEEAQHWFLLLSNGLCSRCSGRGAAGASSLCRLEGSTASDVFGKSEP